PTGSKPGAGTGTGHTDDDIFRGERIDGSRQFIEKHILREKLAAPILSQERLFRKIQIGKFARAEIDSENFAHITAGKSRPALTREKIRVIRVHICHRCVSSKNDGSSRSRSSNRSNPLSNSPPCHGENKSGGLNVLNHFNYFLLRKKLAPSCCGLAIPTGLETTKIIPRSLRAALQRDLRGKETTLFRTNGAHLAETGCLHGFFGIVFQNQSGIKNLL